LSVVAKGDFGKQRHINLLAVVIVNNDPGQLIGLALASVLIVIYFVVAACTGGRRSVHDYVAATEVRPSMAKRNR
jgi:hypothetical protein